MTDLVDSVNEIARLFHRWAKDDSVEPLARIRNKKRADDLEAAAAELSRLQRWSKPVPASYGDISDLPTSLLDQLSGIKTDELEDQIFTVVKAAGDGIELDRLLIEMFRRHGDVHERRFLNNKCYRMVQKGLIHQVSGKKGVYTTVPQSQAEPAKAVHSFSADLDDEIPF